MRTLSALEARVLAVLVEKQATVPDSYPLSLNALTMGCNQKTSREVQMTRAMALEWGRLGINVNAICPGYIETEINQHHWGTEQGKKLVDLLPRKRVGQPQDLDTALMMLCANESHFVNGAVLQVDDGFGV